MKTNIVAATLVTLMISACSTPPKAPPPPPEPVKVEISEQEKAAAIAAAKAAKLAEQLREMNGKSTYFDTNKYAIQPEYRSAIEQQAEFMKANESVVATLEGNADERGSLEYNLALGQKRANAVQKTLEIMGVPARRLNTMSHGEESSRQTCHQEKCWKENRRVDFTGKIAGQ